MTAAACTNNTKCIQSEVVLSRAGHACGDVSIKAHSLVPIRQDDRARPDLTFSLRRRDACPRPLCCVVKRAVEMSGHKTIFFFCRARL